MSDDALLEAAVPTSREAADAGIDRRPVRLGLLLAALAAATAAAILAASGVLALAGLPVTGGAVLLIGGWLGRRQLLDVGVVVMVGGVVFAGLVGAFPATLLAAMVACIVAWDAADHAVSVGEQLGRDARTQRLVLVHVAESTVVGIGAAAIGYGVFRLVGRGHPASAVMLALLGAVLITWAMRR